MDNGGWSAFIKAVNKPVVPKPVPFDWSIALKKVLNNSRLVAAGGAAIALILSLVLK